jgi:hypothetical protein
VLCAHLDEERTTIRYRVLSAAYTDLSPSSRRRRPAIEVGLLALSPKSGTYFRATSVSVKTHWQAGKYTLWVLERWSKPRGAFVTGS